MKADNNLQKLNELFCHTASRYAEVILARQSLSSAVHNLNGRRVDIREGDSLAELLGLSSGGLRTAALLDENQLTDNLPLIASFKRQHIPLSVLIAAEGLTTLPQLAQSGALVFQAFSAQAVADYLLMAQRISEISLIPVVLLAHSIENWEYTIPAERQLQKWFGQPDQGEESSTAAQRMQFGPQRRRMPAWMRVDMPVLNGVMKNDTDRSFEVAAQAAFEWPTVQNTIEKVKDAYQKISGRAYPGVHQLGNDRPRQMMITTLSSHEPLKALLELPLVRKKQLGILCLEQLFPLHWPAGLNLKKTQKLLVLEPLYRQGLQSWLFKEILCHKGFENLSRQNVIYHSEPEVADLRLAFEKLQQSEGPQQYWLGIPFSVKHCGYPKQQLLNEEIKRNYPAIENLGIRAENGKEERPVPQSTPLAARRWLNQGPAFARLDRFYNNTLAVYDSSEMLADPFQSLPLMPVGSGRYLDVGGLRREVPEFRPAKGDDFAAALNSCPYGALPATVVSFEALLKSGIQQLRKKGEALIHIVPQLKVWAKNASREAGQYVGEKVELGELLEAAFTPILTKVSAEKQEALRAEFELILAVLSPLRVSFTEKLFRQAEARRPGSGEILVVAVDPLACTGCGFCAQASEAMQMREPREDDRLKMQREVEALEHLPLCHEDTCERLLEDPEFDSLAAIQLNRDYYQSINGIPPDSEDVEAFTVLRQFSALAAFKLKAPQVKMQGQLAEDIKAIAESIKEMLSNALPMTEIDALMGILSGQREEQLSVDRLLEEWGQQRAFRKVNRSELQRKLHLLKDLQQLQWLLEKGLTGKGRAPYTLVIDHSLAPLAAYPWNPFQVPVLVAEKGHSAATTLGVFKAQQRHALDNIRLLRRARLEAGNRYKPGEHDPQIAALEWADLSQEERALVPPVILLARASCLEQDRFADLQLLLAHDYPVKILLIDSGVNQARDAAAGLNSRNHCFWPLIAQGGSFIGRGSMADTEYVFKLWRRALRFPAGAVVSVLAPRASAFSVHPARWAQIANLAVQTRAFLPLHFDPESPGDGLSMHISTAFDNFDDDWLSTQLSYQQGAKDLTMPYRLTWADWAYLQKAFQTCFKAVDGDAGIPLADYLDLPAGERKHKKALIMRVDKEGVLRHYEVSDNIISATEACRQHFRVLRELAGLYTAFPEKLRQLVDKDLRQEYEKRQQQLEADMAAEKSQWEAMHLEQIKAQMKERLLKMSGH